MQLEDIKLKIDELSIFRNKSKSNVFSHYSNLIFNLNKDINTVVHLWNTFYNSLLEYDINVNIGDYLFEYVLTHNNNFSMACANEQYMDLMSSVILTVKNDLDRLQYLSKIKPVVLRNSLIKKFTNKKDVISNLPIWINEPEKYNLKNSWSSNIGQVSTYYQQNGIANFSLSNIFYINENNKIIKSHIVEDKTELNNEKGILNMYDILQNMSNGKCKNILFRSYNSNISNILAMCIKDQKYSNIKIIKITKKDLVDIDKLLLALTRMPSKFLLLIDNIEMIIDKFYYTLKNSNGYNTLNLNSNNISICAIGNDENFNYTDIFEEIVII